MNINECLNNLDQSLNSAGEIPVLSTITGSLRITLGLAETISNIALSLLALFPLVFQNNKRMIGECANHSVHGIINIIRGAIEALPIIGNVIMYAYNRSDIFPHFDR
jgi:hypothetical protein